MSHIDLVGKQCLIKRYNAPNCLGRKLASYHTQQPQCIASNVL